MRRFSFLGLVSLQLVLAGGCIADANGTHPKHTASTSSASGGDGGAGGTTRNDGATSDDAASSSEAATTGGGIYAGSDDFHPTICDPDLVWTPNASRVEEAPGEGGCPSGMVAVLDYCVDMFEASLVYADTGKSFSPYFNPGSTKVRAVSVKGAIPQAYIDGLEAESACEAAGKRLCSDDEWLRACRGPETLTYPYGDTLMEGLCNDHRAEHPAIEYYGTSASWIWSELDNACIDQQYETVERAGSHPGCVTAEGAYDMMGNVHEWTADPAGSFRGGYFADTKINGPGCLYVTTAHDTPYWDYSTGFRCCADHP